MRLRFVATMETALFLLFGLFAPHAYGQHEITVRFINSRSGKPIKKVYAMVEVSNGREGPIRSDTRIITQEYSNGHDGKVLVTLPPRPSPEATVIFFASTKIDNEGRITIQLPDDTPERVRVSFSPGVFVPSNNRFSPEEVFDSGLVLSDSRNKIHSKVRVSAKPGEVVIVGHKVSVWHNMLQEIP